MIHYPGDWIAQHLSARDRRSMATWALLVYIATLPPRFLFKNQVWMVWALSELAIVISLLAFIAAETPVEVE